MSAEALVDPSDMQRGYSFEELEDAVHGGQWLSAVANRPTPEDHSHRDLSATGVEHLVDAMLDPAISHPVAGGRQRQDLWASAPDTMSVSPEMGTLRKVGYGESSICYEYEHGGRKMAVLFGAYNGDLGLQVPQNPRLTLVNQNVNRNLWRYSDATTYIVLPIGRYNAVTLQEFAGTTTPPRSFLAGIGRAAARANVHRRLGDIDKTRPDLIETEMAKPRHYLYKPGYSLPGIIDIPVEERIR
jgi:hypothetical protein